MDTTTHRPVPGQITLTDPRQLTITDAKRAVDHARFVALLEQAEKDHDPHAVALATEMLRYLASMKAV